MAPNSIHNWHSVDWKAVNKVVVRLRKRIFLASKWRKNKRIRQLQHLLIHSRSNLLYSIRKVTTTNKGSKTPGQDNTTYESPEEKLRLFQDLCAIDYTKYNPVPMKRIYIPKQDGRKRPLGIPTLKDRVLQMIMKNALEPEWEAKFESSSYGFRPCRGVNDAINRAFISLNKENCRKWVVDADIKGCFDNISHDYLLSEIKYFPGYRIVKEWLKAGIIHERAFFETEYGTPQGSIISPLLCNIALHGLEEEVGVKINPQGYTVTGGPSFIRYADDFIILCYTKNEAIAIKENLNNLLSKRGLVVAENKTRIAHICEGFDFLGFRLQIAPKDGYENKDVILKRDDDYEYSYQKTLMLIRPSDKSIDNFKSRVKAVFQEHYGSTAGKLILNLNPIIRGWATSKQNWHCNRTFHKLDHYLFNLCVRWMRRSHPNKPWYWLKAKYFTSKTSHGFNNKWVFWGELPNKKGAKSDPIRLELFQLKWFKPFNHIMVLNSANPDDPVYTRYFREFTQKRAMSRPITSIPSFDRMIVEEQDH